MCGDMYNAHSAYIVSAFAHGSFRYHMRSSFASRGRDTVFASAMAQARIGGNIALIMCVCVCKPPLRLAAPLKQRRWPKFRRRPRASVSSFGPSRDAAGCAMAGTTIFSDPADLPEELRSRIASLADAWEDVWEVHASLGDGTSPECMGERGPWSSDPALVDVVPHVRTRSCHKRRGGADSELKCLPVDPLKTPWMDGWRSTVQATEAEERESILEEEANQCTKWYSDRLKEWRATQQSAGSLKSSGSPRDMHVYRFGEVLAFNAALAATLTASAPFSDNPLECVCTTSAFWIARALQTAPLAKSVHITAFVANMSTANAEPGCLKNDIEPTLSSCSRYARDDFRRWLSAIGSLACLKRRPWPNNHNFV